MSAEDIRRIVELFDPRPTSIFPSYKVDLPITSAQRLGFIDYGNVYGKSDDDGHKEIVVRNAELPEISDSLSIPNRLHSVMLHLNGSSGKAGILSIYPNSKTVEDYSHVLTEDQMKAITGLGYSVIDGNRVK